MRLPEGTISSQLRAALKGGMTAEQATSAVLAPYGAVLQEAGNDSLATYSRPAVLAEARRLHRQMTRRAEDRAFGAAPGTRERQGVRELAFHLPDGTVVSWADATAEQHEARITWLQTFISSMEQDLRRHERVVKLLAERGADRLSDIEGWESLVGDDLDDPEDEPADDASGEAAA